MTITLNGTTGITSPEVVLDNTSADGGQTVLKSSGFSDWNLDNYNGRLRAYNGSTERMTIDTSGNVGIGTSSPSNKFVVSNAGAAGVEVNPTTGNIFTFNRNTSVYTDMVLTANNAIFQTGGTTERMRIDSSGNLLVNRTSAYSDGSIGTPLIQCGGINGVKSGAAFIQNSTASTGAIGFANPNGYCGGISTSGTSTTYSTSSDYRLKENIAPMTGALAKVSALKPVTYTWKIDGSSGQGFIAHELAEVVPDAVTGEKDAVDADEKPVYQGIDTSFLVATLTAAIQELKAELDTVKAEVTALKGTA